MNKKNAFIVEAQLQKKMDLEVENRSINVTHVANNL